MRSQQGFTVAELIVVMTLTLLFTTMLLSFMFDTWGQAGRLQNSNETLVTRQNLGDSIRNRLNLASSLMNQNSIPDPNANVAEASDQSGLFWPLLRAVPRTILMPPKNAASPILYYEAPAEDGAKNFIMRGVSPHQNEFVIYLDGTSKQLKLRSLADQTATGNALLTSCPESAASDVCPEDRVLAEYVSDVTLRYFSKSGNSINFEDVKDPETGESIGPDFPDVEVVEMSVRLTKRATIKGTPASDSSTTIRVALRNG